MKGRQHSSSLSPQNNPLMLGILLFKEKSLNISQSRLSIRLPKIILLRSLSYLVDSEYTLSIASSGMCGAIKHLAYSEINISQRL